MGQKTKDLLIHLLLVINQACDGCTVNHHLSKSPIYTPQFWDAPVFELDNVDIEVIENLSKFNPRLQELLERCKNAKPIVY